MESDTNDGKYLYKQVGPYILSVRAEHNRRRYFSPVQLWPVSIFRFLCLTGHLILPQIQECIKWLMAEIVAFTVWVVNPFSRFPPTDRAPRKNPRSVLLAYGLPARPVPYLSCRSAVHFGVPHLGQIKHFVVSTSNKIKHTWLWLYSNMKVVGTQGGFPAFGYNNAARCKKCTAYPPFAPIFRLFIVREFGDMSDFMVGVDACPVHSLNPAWKDYQKCHIKFLTY